MSVALPTVRVVNPDAPGGYMIINEVDLNGSHTLWAAPAPAAIGRDAVTVATDASAPSPASAALPEPTAALSALPLRSTATSSAPFNAAPLGLPKGDKAARGA